MANQAKTINQKGDLMSYRPDIKLLDATIRDGGLVNNFGFSDEFVKELYKTNIKSGVEYMEFGYKASKELFDMALWDEMVPVSGSSVMRRISELSLVRMTAL